MSSEASICVPNALIHISKKTYTPTSNTDISVMPLSDQGVRSLWEEMQLDMVIPFLGKVCDLSKHSVPTWMPLLAHVGKCTGKAMTGVLGLSTDPLEAQSQ